MYLGPVNCDTWRPIGQSAGSAGVPRLWVYKGYVSDGYRKRCLRAESSREIKIEAYVTFPLDKQGCYPLMRNAKILILIRMFNPLHYQNSISENGPQSYNAYHATDPSVH